MFFVSNNCRKLVSRGQKNEYSLGEDILTAVRLIKDIGVIVSSNLGWTKHVQSKVARTKSVFHMVRRNIGNINGLAAKVAQ